MKVELKTITPDVENTIVEIARVSSSRENKTEDSHKLINYLIKNSHWSPFEHGFITFEIETSKAIGIQLLRHRSFTFQEFSQRYSKVTSYEEVELREQAKKNRQSSINNIGDNRVIVGSVEQNETLNEIFNAHIKTTDLIYNMLLENGVAKECARMILPMCTSTTIYMTGSVRSWLSFLNIRLDHHAQKEIVEISREIALQIKEVCPNIVKATNDFNNFNGMFM